MKSKKMVVLCLLVILLLSVAATALAAKGTYHSACGQTNSTLIKTEYKNVFYDHPQHFPAGTCSINTGDHYHTVIQRTVVQTWDCDSCGDTFKKEYTQRYDVCPGNGR